MTTPFRIAGHVVLAAWVATLLLAAVVAGHGVASLAGWTDGFDRRVDLVPGTGLVVVDLAPTWDVVAGGPVCRAVDPGEPPSDCYGFVLSRDDAGLDGGGGPVRSTDVQPVEARLSGPLSLDAEPGWNPLMASLVLMRALALLVVAGVLFSLWRLLRSAASGEPFTGSAVRRLRTMGALLLGWELLEPLLWLVLSPKAWDYGESSYAAGATGSLQLGSMEPGGPELTVMAFGALLLLLAEVFRRGAQLADDQRLTV